LEEAPLKLDPRFHMSPAVAFPPAVKWITCASTMGRCGDRGDAAHSWVSLSCQMKSNRERLGASQVLTLRPGVAPRHQRAAHHKQQENHCKAPAQSSGSLVAPSDASGDEDTGMVRGGAPLPCTLGMGAVCGEQEGARKRMSSRAVGRIRWCRQIGGQASVWSQ